jgi:hypothetical protein
MRLKRSLIVDSSLLLIVIAVSAVGCCVAFIRSGKPYDLTSVAIAAAAVAVALIPPLWLEDWMASVAAAPLATVLWRLGVLLPVILYSTYKIEPARNCVQVTLLACYLMTLPLESWLLIRQSRP